MKVLSDFGRSHPYRSFTTLACLLLAGVAEGIGLSSLFPVLELAAPSGGAEPSGFGEAVRDALSGIGVEPTLGALLLIVVSGIVGKAVLVLLANRQVGYAVSSVATELRLALIGALMTARWRYFATRPAGSIANAFTTEAERASLAFLHSSLVIAAGIQVLLYTGIALAISWKVTLAALAVGAMSAWALTWLVRAARRAGRRQTELLKSSVAHLADALHAIKPLRAMAREQLMDTMLTRETEDLNRAQRGEVLSKEGLKALQEPILVGGLALGLYVAVSYWSMSIAYLLMFGVLFGRTLGAIGKAQKEIQKFVTRESAYESLLETIDAAEAEREPLKSGVTPTLREGIELRNIRLVYRGEPVLANVNVFVPAGKLTTLIGASGAGKTSLADMIVGLVTPESGTVLVDGVDLNDIDIRAWRTMIGYVPQELYLLHESIFTNVTLGDTEISEAQVWRALERVGARTFVDGLPEKLHAPVGERGLLLSGGQRQRIAIARAIVRTPTLLVLDEATASLDPIAENAVVSTVAALRGDMTILAITHQKAFADRADHVYRVEDGAVSDAR
ncbi:MAG TPA: ABC transporter ATP-binding protein [Gammaproteobacteria bacterium]|jgi:ATP-binding cassette subfamily C protein|nr:ABC transporter ATP-binding protein [Gammaproteobacteria bacterium]